MPTLSQTDLDNAMRDAQDLGKFVNDPAGTVATRTGGTYPNLQSLIDTIEESGGGDVVGPASATNNALAQFNGTTGKLIKNSSTTIDTDGTLAADSDTRVPTQKAVNTRVNSVMQTQPCFQANKNGTNQTAIASAVITKITFTTEEFDTGGFYDATNSRWIPPAGVVEVYAQIEWGSANQVDQSAAVIYIYKNGSAFKRNDTNTSSAATHSCAIRCQIPVNGTDYIEVFAECSSAGDKQVHGTAQRSFFGGRQVVRT